MSPSPLSPREGHGEEDMPTIIRPRRSIPFMPNSNTRAFERAKTLLADALIEAEILNAERPTSKPDH